jgi:hypothetical protein
MRFMPHSALQAHRSLKSLEMFKMIRVTATAIAACLLLASTSAYAQEDTGAGTAADPKINTVIVFGDDQCPESTDEQINVCAILVEGDRYRIPAVLRDDPNNPKNDAWMNRVLAYQYVGRDGTQSCSASGAGGFTGCGLKAIDQAYAEKSKDPGLAFGRMIAEERKRRLAGIDAEAQEVEQRVVQFEKERAEKEAREANAPAPPADEAADSEPLPQPK